MLEELGRLVRMFLIAVVVVFIGIPLCAVGIVLLMAYIFAPAVAGIAVGYLLVFPAMLSVLPHDPSVAISVCVALVVAIFGWTVMWWINDVTEFPFEMLDL